MATTLYAFRLDDDLMRQVKEHLAARYDHPTADPWTLTDFVREAVKELLRKKAASRTRRARPNREAQRFAEETSKMDELVILAPELPEAEDLTCQG